jgi:tetratricopeptide (TPR) repeat protein
MLSGSTLEEVQARAAELYGRGDFTAAADEYRKLIEINPRNAQALKGLGLSLVRAKQIEEGIQACANAALLQPTDAEVRYAYGYALGSARRYHEATEHLDAALNLQPNHIGAKQALVYSLLTQGQELVQNNDAYNAERYFDRAHKLDQQNPEITGALLNALYLTQQKGKLTQALKELDDRTKQHPSVQPVIAKIEADPDYQAAVKTASYASAPTAPAKPSAQTLQQTPCPNCRQMIMEWAAVCPHCNFRIKAMGTFATHDRGPNVIWQEVALTIVAILWSLSAAYDLYKGLQIQIEMIKALVVTLSGASLGVGLGLLFRIDWLGWIAKLLLCLNILGGLYSILLATAATKTGVMLAIMGVSVLQIAIAGFLLYLINYCMD